MWAWLVQVSDQAVRLWQEGWFQASAQPSGVSVLRNPKVCHALAQALSAGVSCITQTAASWHAQWMRIRASVASLPGMLVVLCMPVFETAVDQAYLT